MIYEIEGIVKDVLPVVTGMGRNGPWGRQTVVVEFEDGRYTSLLAMDNLKRYEEFGKLRRGKRGKFKFTVTSREYKGRYYTSATCLNWEMTDDAAKRNAASEHKAGPESSAPAPQAPKSDDDDDNDDDGLPF